MHLTQISQLFLRGLYIFLLYLFSVTACYNTSDQRTPLNIDFHDSFLQST